MQKQFNIRISFLMGWLLYLAVAVNVQAGTSMISEAVKNKTLVVGVTLSEPWVMKNYKGEWLGYDIDVAHQLGKDLGVSVRFNEYPWQELVEALESSKVDIVISGMTITTPRNIKVNFTIPYSNSGIALLANKSNTGKLQEKEDFNQPGIRIASRQGSIAVDIAREEFPKANFILVEREQEMIDQVKSGKVHGLLAASPLPEFLFYRYPDDFSMPLAKRLSRTSEAFAIRQQDSDSLNILNNWILQKLHNNWLQDRHDYWFTTSDWRSRL